MENTVHFALALELTTTTATHFIWDRCNISSDNYIVISVIGYYFILSIDYTLINSLTFTIKY